MKILVTGSNGFIGRHYCNYAENDSIIAKADKSLGIDISKDPTVFNQFGKCDAVLHLAATNATTLFYEQPTDITVNDTLAIINLVEYYRKTNTKIVFSSSSEVITGAVDSGIATVPTDESIPIVFTDIKNPRWSYSLPKALGENLIINSGAPWLIIRYFNVYGPGQRYHFLDEFITRVAAGEYYIKGNDYRSFCYVDDAVQMTHTLVKHHSNTIVNVGNPEMLLISTVAKIVMDLMGIDPDKLDIMPGKVGSVAKRCPDTTLVKELTGFTQYTSLRDGLRKTIESLV
jgi:nucleoside-diphosphate-sugar epimerase